MFKIGTKLSVGKLTNMMFDEEDLDIAKLTAKKIPNKKANKLGLVDEEINVKMPGGNLFIEIDKDEQIYMTGPVEAVFEGTF